MKKSSFFISVIIFVFFYLISSAFATTTDPEEVLKEKIDQIVLLLDDPSKKEEVFLIVKSIFDFDEISKRALAQKWKTFSPKDRENFVCGFSRKLFEVYYKKVSGNSSASEIFFLGQRMKKDTSEVSTKIVRGGIETPVAYRMKLSDDGQWKVYDVIIEGVSLVANYRAQLSPMKSTDIMAQIMTVE